MISDPWFYAAAVPAMILLGISKGGFGAIGILVVPIMATVISPVQAAGIVLPILILSDVVALMSYRNSFDKPTLFYLLPGAMLGILIGWLTAAWVSEDHIRLIIGIVSVAFALTRWLPSRRNLTPADQSVPRAALWGTVSGFTSFVSHAGGPPFQMYAAPLRLEPQLFAGTMVIMFAIVNAVKLVPFFFLGQFDATNLETSAVLLPASIPATLLGIWLVKRLDKERFYSVIYALMLVVGLYLVYDAVSAVLAHSAA